MGDIASGLELLLQWQPIVYLVAGVVGGFVIGVLPGLSGSNAAALVLPFSIGLPLESALLLIVGIYAGAQFAGAVPAILMNVPGDAGTAATALDGYPMAQQGKAELAIGIARMASVVGGVIAMLVVLTIVGPLSDLALSFGAREMFVVAVFGLMVIASVVGDNVLKGLVSALIGLLIASMSANAMTAQARFTFGFLELYEEVPFIPAIIGLFGFAQMFLIATQKRFFVAESDLSGPGVGNTAEPVGRVAAVQRSMGEVWEGIRTTLSYPGQLLRSSLIGLTLGVVPGIGTSVSNFITYGDARRRSKHPERFGKGAPEGIIASESCDNAVAAGTLVPTMTLGIPGSATAAIMLAALYLHGVQPGPQVMQTNSAEVYAVFLGMLLAAVLILPIGVLLATPLTAITRLAPAYLASGVLVLCAIGAYASRTSLFDVGLALVFGLLGLAMRVGGYSVIPLILGLILGPIAESNFLRALQLGNNQIGYFFDSTAALVLWAMLGVVVVLSTIKSVRASRRRSSRSAPSAGDDQLLAEPRA